MNLVIVTSVIRPINDQTIFSAGQRFEQTMETIKTVLAKVPNCQVFVVEGGILTDVEISTFKSVANLFQTDITHLPKSKGEACLLYRFLTSSEFMKLNVKTISKLSGRYKLTNDFNWFGFPINKIIIKYTPISWRGLPCYQTRYYRIPKNQLTNMTTGLKYYYENVTDLDIEHGFVSFIDTNHVYSPLKLGVTGLITNTGQTIVD